MTMPLSRPADGTAVDPLTRELAAQGHRVVFSSDGGEPSLTAVGGQLRGYSRTGRTAEAADRAATPWCRESAARGALPDDAPRSAGSWNIATACRSRALHFSPSKL